MKTLLPAAAALTVLALGACAPQSPQATACPVAPPLTREDIPKPPVSEAPLIWQPGHWDWTGAAYTWNPGVWAPRQQGQSNQWLDGYWARTPGGQCGWLPAHWV